jgi:hypothetical protein
MVFAIVEQSRKAQYRVRGCLLWPKAAFWHLLIHCWIVEKLFLKALAEKGLLLT